MEAATRTSRMEPELQAWPGCREALGLQCLSRYQEHSYKTTASQEELRPGPPRIRGALWTDQASVEHLEIPALTWRKKIHVLRRFSKHVC